jgi:hypothetical protein
LNDRGGHIHDMSTGISWLGRHLQARTRPRTFLSVMMFP